MRSTFVEIASELSGRDLVGEGVGVFLFSAVLRLEGKGVSLSSRELLFPDDHGKDQLQPPSLV